MDEEIDHRWLRLLCAIVEDRSVSKAAARLGVTQPTASYLLGRLRARLRDPLFEKTPEGMAATPRTLALYREIRRGLDILDAAFDPAPFDPSSSEHAFRIGTLDLGELMFLPPILRRLQRIAPHVSLRSMPMPAEHLPNGMDRGEIDFAIGAVPVIAARTHHEVLFHENYVVVTRRGRLKARSTLTRKTFAELEFIQIESPYLRANEVERLIAENDLIQRIKLTIANYTSVAAVVAATDLAAIVPSRTASALAPGFRLTAWPLPFAAPSFPVRLHWSARREANAAQQWMRGALIETLRRL